MFSLNSATSDATSQGGRGRGALKGRGPKVLRSARPEAWALNSPKERVINAATECMPLPDPDLPKPCCPHLLLLIPPQYSCSRPPSHKGGGGAEAPLLQGAGSRLAAEPRPEGICCWFSGSICYYFSPPPPACCGVRFLPKVGRPCSLPIRHCPPVPTALASLPRCRRPCLLAVCNPNPKHCVIGQCH